MNPALAALRRNVQRCIDEGAPVYTEIPVQRFRIFTRTWWVENPDWPNGLEPGAGRKRTIGYAATEELARFYCQRWNATHKPGRLSRKAEFEGA